MPSQSSSRLNLIQLKLQAKELRKAHTAGESEALERIKAHLPLLAAASEQKLNKYPLSLTEAKHVIAGENGLAGWPKLKRYVELGQFELQVEALQKAHSAGDPDACRLIKANFPVLAGYSESNICAYPLSLEEAQLVIARDNGFAGRTEIVNYLLEQGAEDLDTSLRTAVGQGHLEIAQLLLEKGADPSKVRKFAQDRRLTSMLELLGKY